MRRILVVANRTLSQDSLLEAIKSRVAEGPCEFTLIVPATAPTEGGGGRESSPDVTWPGTARQAGDFALPERSYEQAQQRLEYGLERFRRAGAVVNGDVVGSNALDAMSDAVHRHQFDEIIISTLPRKISRWLRQDLPHRARRKFGLPITVITPHDAVGQ
jgi:GABA permease